MVASSLMATAADVAADLLSPLGDRWHHVLGVVNRARYVATLFTENDAKYLIAAAYLHDVGYAPALVTSGFHPLDGAKYIADRGDLRLASLVAHHSGARFEAAFRGLSDQIRQFPMESSAVADALTYCDLMTGPTGLPVTFKQRTAGILNRYDEQSTVVVAYKQALPSISLQVARTVKRLKANGILIAC